MKTLVTIATLALLAINSVATAMPIMPPAQKDNRVLIFNLLTEGSKVSPKHVSNFSGGTAEINYAANTVTLRMYGAPKCPEGFSCPEVLEVNEVELPIVDIYSDNECFLTVVAKKDMRPADGALEQIKIDDFSNSKCPYFLKPISDVQYLTSYISRTNGKNITTVSTLKADLTDITQVPVADEFYALTTGEYISGFRQGEEVQSGSLTISTNTVHLEVYNKSNCPDTAMCFGGPTVIMGDFAIESREGHSCGETIVAVDQTPGVGRKLVIQNYAHSICDIYTPNLVTVDYTAIVMHPKAHNKQVAKFYFDYMYVPFQK